MSRPHLGRHRRGHVPRGPPAARTDPSFTATLTLRAATLADLCLVGLAVTLLFAGAWLVAAARTPLLLPAPSARQRSTVTLPQA